VDLHNFLEILRDEDIGNREKYDAFIAFKIYYDGLCDFILKNQKFSDDQLTPHIFNSKWPEAQDDLVFKKHLFAAKMTFERLNKLIKEANFEHYEFLLSVVAHDLFSIIKVGEENYRHSRLSFVMKARPDQDPREVFDVAEVMLHFGTIDPKNAYLREVFPVSIFLLRQTIELYGKRVFGFKSITDKYGNRTRSVSTQVAWEFVKREAKKKDSRIKLPVNVDTIVRIEEWTNRYVHTGDLQRLYLIENAIHFVGKLIYSMNEEIKDYEGKIKYYGTTQITGYNAIKDEFERYVNPAKPKRNKLVELWHRFFILIRMKKKPKEIIVNWVHVDKVHATILSL